jgi:flagellar basal-body rod protein FlgF
MTGAQARLDELDTISDNLANAQTPGFKAARPSYEAYIAHHGHTTEAEPAAVALSSTGVDLRPGQSMTTGRPLDVVPENGAFLAIQSEVGGLAFTRNGNLQVDAFGRLTAQGRPVLDSNGGPIQVPAGAAPSIGTNGTITAGGVSVGKLALYQLHGPAVRLGGSVVVTGEGGAATPVEGQVQTGQLELSNSNPLQLTVDLINVQRQYEMGMQALQAYKTLATTANQVGHVQ